MHACGVHIYSYLHEFAKDSVISRNKHHNLLMGRVTARYAMEWMTRWRVGTRRGVSEHLVPVVWLEGVRTKGASYGNRANAARRAKRPTCADAETNADAPVS